MIMPQSHRSAFAKFRSGIARSITSLEKYFLEMPVHMISPLILMMKPLNLHFCSAAPV